MSEVTGIARALVKFDASSTKLAAAIGHGVSRQNVEHWLREGRVPQKRCAVVSLATGIPVDELNPEVDWATTRRALSATGAAA